MDRVRVAIQDTRDNWAYHAIKTPVERVVPGVFRHKGIEHKPVEGAYGVATVQRGIRRSKWQPRWLSRWLNVRYNARLVKRQENALSFLKGIGALSQYRHPEPILEPYNELSSHYTYRQIEIDLTKMADHIVQSILQSHDQVIALYNRKCDRVIVGYDVAIKLMDDPQFMSFQVPPTFDRPVARHGRYGDLRIDNLWIQVVPWFKGILVVPDDDR